MEMIPSRPGTPKAIICELLEGAGLDPTVRAETVRVDQFLQIARLLTSSDPQW
jgi:16S rRNA A1518/A1519 N6-dimethyltransferase RsmA/KsgA/DIM1 with predicted DNA glycosylase/AP lyase activity